MLLFFLYHEKHLEGLSRKWSQSSYLALHQWNCSELHLGHLQMYHPHTHNGSVIHYGSKTVGSSGTKTPYSNVNKHSTATCYFDRRYVVNWECVPSCSVIELLWNVWEIHSQSIHSLPRVKQGLIKEKWYKWVPVHNGISKKPNSNEYFPEQAKVYSNLHLYYYIRQHFRRSVWFVGLCCVIGWYSPHRIFSR